MKTPRPLFIRLALLAIPAALAGCVIEPFAETVQVPRPNAPLPYTPPPASAYLDPATQQAGSPPVDSANPSTLPLGTGEHQAQYTSPTTQLRPKPAGPVVIDSNTANRIGQTAHDLILKRYPAAKDAKLNDYLLLVGSLVSLGAPRAEADYQFVLLDTPQPISAATYPKTIYLSRGLLTRMEDESELAGAIAREITNLTTGRALQAIGYARADALVNPTSKPATPASSTPPAGTSASGDPANTNGATPASATIPGGANTAVALEPVATVPATAPATGATSVTLSDTAAKQAAQKLADLLLSDSLPGEVAKSVDLDGARLAAAAKYAPDGYLRFLTRLKNAGPNSPEWDRIKALDASVAILSKANPLSDVRLPVRFEGYVRQK